MALRNPAGGFQSNGVFPDAEKPLNQINIFTTSTLPRYRKVNPLRMSGHADSPPAFVPEPKDGFQYAVGELIGKGGFAICHKAERLEQRKPTNHFIALKIVRTKIEPAKLAQKFITELQIHSKMDHPNIVEFYRAFTFEQSTYCVLELCDNGSLADMLKKRKFLSMPEIRRFVVQICGAIKYLHQRSVVHRDLKTGNIFLDKNMNVKLGDFGLAAVLASSGDIVKRRTTMCGTPNYLAPEILEKGIGHNEKVDLWAVGVIAYTLAVGKAPFHAATKEEIYKKLKSRTYDWPELDNHRNDISNDLRDLVASILVDESERPSPDAIVSHNFFKIAFVPSEISTMYLARAPKWSQNLPPSRETLKRGYSESWFQLCFESGVGEYEPGRKFALNGGKKIRTIVRECEKEVIAGLQPVVPLPADRVYLPYPDRYDWLTGGGSRNDLSAITEEKESSIEESRHLREIAPNAAVREKKSRRVSKSRAELLKPVKSFVPPPTIWVDAGAATAPPPRATQRKMQTQPRRPPNRKLLADEAYPVPRTRAPPETKRVVRTASVRPTVQTPTAGRRTRVTRTSSRTLNNNPSQKPPIPIYEDSSPQELDGECKLSSKGDSDIKPDTETQSSPAPTAETTKVFGTDPVAVLNRLAAFRDNVAHALKSTSTTGRTSTHIKRKTPEEPPQHLPLVAKWVDYSSKMGIGYFTRGGLAGCLISDKRQEKDMSSSGQSEGTSLTVKHVVARDGEQQIADLMKAVELPTNTVDRAAEATKHGLSFEMYEDHCTAENKQKRGIESMNLTSAQRQHLVRLWFSFSKFTVNSLRPLEKRCLADAWNTPEHTSSSLTASSKKSDPGDFVRLYQRVGNVGIWAFASGCTQFNFPDHTKLIFSPMGSQLSFEHLSPSAVKHLKAGRPITEEMLIRERRRMSCPTETMLKGTLIGEDGELKKFDDEMRANALRGKLEWVLALVEKWISGGGMGLGEGLDMEGQMLWHGAVTKESQQKIQYSAVGRWGGDGKIEVIHLT